MGTSTISMATFNSKLLIITINKEIRRVSGLSDSPVFALSRQSHMKKCSVRNTKKRRLWNCIHGYGTHMWKYVENMEHICISHHKYSWLGFWRRKTYFDMSTIYSEGCSWFFILHHIPMCPDVSTTSLVRVLSIPPVTLSTSTDRR